MFDINTTKGYFLHLAKCSLNDEQPMEKPEKVSFEELFSFAKKQKATNLLWYSIEKLNNKPDLDLYQSWYSDYGYNLQITAYQEMEAKNLNHLFASNGYKSIALNGCQIRPYYKYPDMRYMADIDLLVNTKDKHSIKEMMLSDDFEIASSNVYKRDNGVVCEIQHTFMKNDNPYCEHFNVDYNELTLQDLYYYTVGGIVDKLYSKGIGFKQIVDIYVLWTSMTKEQQFKINSRLLTAGLNDFNVKLVKVAEIWFGDREDDGETLALQDYLLDNSKSYKEAVDFIRNENISPNEEHSSKLLPSSNELFIRFNVKNRIPALLPFLWVIYIILLPFSKKQKTEKVVEASTSVPSEDIEFIKKLFTDFGLDIKK